MVTRYTAGEASLTIVPDAREFRTKLEADLRKIQVDYAVQVTADLARARAELDKFRAEQEANAVKLRAEVNRDHLRQSLNSVKSDFEELGETLGKALKIDLTTAGIALLPSLATGLASVAQAMEQVADAGLALPGILAGVGASVGTVALGLTGVKEAWSAVTKAASESAADQVRQAQQVTSATNSLRNAVHDEAQAQKDVADARRDAREQLEDLNIQLRGGALNEKEAILEAQRARRDLATGRYKDSIDYQEAVLRVQEADQRVVESHQRNIELQQKVQRENAKGVENSDRVVSANERLVRSQQAVAQAQTSLSTADASSPAAKAAEAMAKLSPNAREFLQTMINLKPAFIELRNSDAQHLFDGLSVSLKTLVQSDLPTLKNGIGAISTALNHDIRQLLGSLGSDSSKGFLDRILGNTADADERIKGAIDPLVHAIGVLTTAGSDTLPRLAQAFDHVADRFDKFITAAANDGRLAKWINDGETAFTHLGDIALNLGETFHGISKALGGKGLLADLDDFTKKLSTLVNSDSGQQKLIHFFQEGRDEFHKWEPVIENLAKLLPPMFAAAKQSADQFLPVIKNITDFLVKHPQLVQDAVGAYLLWNTTLKPIADVAGAIKDVSKFVRFLIDDIHGVGTAAEATATKVEAAATREIAAEDEVGAAAAAEAGAFGGTPGVAPVPGKGGKPGLGSRLGGAALGLAIPVVIAQAINPDTVPVLTNLLQGKDKDGRALSDKYQSPVPPAPPPDKDPTGGQGLGGLASIPSSQGGLGANPAPPPPPPPGLDHADEWKSLADKGDPMAKWVLAGTDPADQARRAEWLKAHQDVLQGQTFTAPLAYAAGGGTPSSPGPLPDGGYHAVIHPKEFVSNPTGRATLGDPFLTEANRGNIDTNLLPHFDDGGPGDGVDVHQDPRDAAPNPATLGPQSIAPNPTMGGGGILNSILAGTASGLQGPIGNAISLGSSLINQGMAQSGAFNGGGTGTAGGALGGFGGFGGGGGGGGGSMIPGIWGLAQAGNNPDALMQWGSQTAQWTANFASKTLMSGAQIGIQGVLGGLGLSGLSGYGKAISSTAGFYLGPDGPFAKMGSGGNGGATPQLGAQSIQLGDGSTIQVPTFGTSDGASAGAALGDATGGAAAPGGDIIADNPQSRAAGLFAGRTPGNVTPELLQQAGIKPVYNWGPGSTAEGNVPDWVKSLAGQFGLVASTYNKDDTLHHGGYAWDFNDPANPNAWSPKLDAFATFIQQHLGGQTLQLIHANPQTGEKWGIAAGQGVGPGTASPGYYGNNWAGHFDHVHWATDVPVLLSPTTNAAGQKTWWQGWSPGAASGPTPGASGMGSGDLRNMARQLYAKAGMPPGEWDAFEQLISNESGWKPNAQNPGSSAFGLGQFLNSTWASVGGSKTADPATQLMLIFKYLQSRPDYHGSPAAALALWNARSPHWYDVGGDWPTGTVGVNQSGKTETVLTHQQTQDVHQALTTAAQTINATAPQQSPNAEHLQAPQGPQQAPRQPVSTAETPPPSPTSSQPNVPPPVATGGAPLPGLGAQAVAPAPSNLDHNLKAIDTGIDSAAQAIGQAASTAIGIAASAAGSSGFAPGAGAVGAIGPYVAGLIQEGGKVAKDLVNVPSSFLVGNVTAGTQDLAYGAPLRPAQNTPNVATTNTNITNISGNYELRAAMDAHELQQQQNQQTYLAHHGRISG